MKIQCDRCKNNYDATVDTKIYSLTYTIANTDEREVHICPNCLSELEKFIKSESDERPTTKEKTSSERFIDNRDGTILDMETSLMWAKEGSDEKMNFKDAGKYCKDFNLGGHKDWRLPTIKELISIIDYEKYNPAIDPVFECDFSWYWSGSSFVGVSDRSWLVSFYDGCVTWASRAGYYYVLPVRKNLQSKTIQPLKLQFEEHNFRVNSDDWEQIVMNGKSYLQNPEKDIWELNDGELKGEQLFTWKAAMRETKKAGKRMPTDKEFSEILKSKSDMPNILYTGYRYTGGSFGGLSSGTGFWSSSQSGGNAWDRGLFSGYPTVFRSTNGKALGFSVRCLKN